MMTFGTESISRQKDSGFLKKLEQDVEETFDIIKLSIPDIMASHEESDHSYEYYDKYKKQLKDKLFNKVLSSMSKTLTNRFGIKFTMSNMFNQNEVSTILMPPLNSRVLDMAMSDLDSLFPKKKANSILWNIVATKNEQLSYNNIRNLRDAIQSEKFSLDLKHAKVKGLDYTEIPLKFNFLHATILNLKPSEVVSLILQKIGILFTHLDYMYTTTNNNFILLDTYMKEKFAKQTPPLDALKIALSKTDADIKVNSGTPVALLETLNMYILKTYRFDSGKGSIKINYEALSDEFVSLFGYGDTLSSAVIKVRTYNTVVTDDETSGTFSTLVSVLNIFTYLTIVIMGILFFSIFGILSLVIMLGVTILGFVISYLMSFIESIIAHLFSTDIDKADTTEVLLKRLDRLKMDVIKQLRKLSGDNKLENGILVSQIDAIKKNIAFIKEKSGIIYDYGENHFSTKSQDIMAQQNEFIEQMSENELHFYKAKFSDLEK